MGSALTSPDILLALAIGIIPSIFWLAIWLRTDKLHPEPFGLLLLCFILGGGSVFFATALQHATTGFVSGIPQHVALYAGIEELLKFFVFYFLAYKSPFNDEAIDPAIYMIAVALGFAALENIFYVLKPGLSFNLTANLLTGGLRFFGSTLLHTIASAFVGIMITLGPKNAKAVGIILGLIGATMLHTTFNFFILENSTATFLQVYGYLWIAAIISHIILEKLQRIPLASSEAPLPS